VVYLHHPSGVVRVNPWQLSSGSDIAVTLSNARLPREDPPDMKQLVAAIAVLVVLGLVIKHWVIILIVAAAITAMALVWLLGIRLRDRRRSHIEQQQQIATRADTEHRQYLAGDARGIYGTHMPADLDGHLGTLDGLRRLPPTLKAWRDERRR